MTITNINKFNMQLTALFYFILVSSCNNPIEPKTINNYKEEVRQTELDFSKMANEKGIGEAFNYFAAKDVVLNRSNKLITGKDSLVKYFENPLWKTIKLEWEPDFVDVSASGDLAYTYGKYVLTQIDSVGNKNSSTGIFHTVWKRQKNGEWKFVWD